MTAIPANHFRAAWETYRVQDAALLAAIDGADHQNRMAAADRWLQYQREARETLAAAIYADTCEFNSRETCMALTFAQIEDLARVLLFDRPTEERSPLTCPQLKT